MDFHSLRHTYISLQVKRQVPMKIVQQLARHSDINLTANRYTDVSSLPVRDAIVAQPRLFDDGGGPICGPMKRSFQVLARQRLSQ